MRRLIRLLRVRRDRMESDLDRELRYHLDRRIGDMMQAGLDEAEARRQAAIEFGGLTQVQEEVRDTWYRQGFDNLIRNLRYSWRTLWRNPVFTTTAVLSLALGIGANTAIFSLFDQILLKRLPVQEPERLVFLDWNGSNVGVNYGSDMLSYPLCRDVQKLDRFFDGAFCRYPNRATVAAGTVPEALPVEIVSGSYFRVLGVRPELGRLFEDSDDLVPEASPVVVISHEYWQRHLGGKPDAIGRKVRINNFPMTVIGVAPPSFHGVDLGYNPVLWIPASMKSHASEAFDASSRRVFWMHVFARLKPSVNAEQAMAGLRPWFQQMLEEDANRPEFPKRTDQQRRGYLASTLDVIPTPGGRSGLRSRLTRPLTILTIGTGLLLLLACVNVTNLFLARTAALSEELTTRLALGASRGSIVGQLLTDSMLIAGMGGLLSLLIAPAIAQVLLAYFSDDMAWHLDWRVFLFAFAATVTVGGMTGLIPALKVKQVSLIASLRERSRLTRGGIRLRKVLVAGQVAFTLILLIGAGLFLQTLQRLYGRGPGFTSGGLLVFSASPGSNGHSVPEARRIMGELLEKVRTVPGVESAAIANTQVLRGGTSSGYITIQAGGRRIVTDREVHRMRVTPGFFSTLGLPMLAGRDFDNRDLRNQERGETGYRSIIVSESFVRRYLDGIDPIGLRLGLSNRPGAATTVEIIGVVRGFSRRTMRDSSNEIEQAFLPYWDGETDGGAFYARVRGNPEAAFGSIRAAVGQVDSTLPVVDLVSLEELIDESLVTERMLSAMSMGFAAVALLLSAVGVYGVMSFVVTQRTGEIGIRMALGAQRSKVLRLILYDAAITIAAGVAAALPAIWSLSRFVEGQLFGIEALDRINILSAIILLALVAVTAALLPAWRAARVSPIEALRQS